jgi:hypothetical protein
MGRSGAPAKRKTGNRGTHEDAYKEKARKMNNEPVAWMNRLGRLEYEQGNGFEIPLYTHPAKTLTDEEIIEVWNVLEDTHSAENDAKVFARAILRKAQEK